MIRYLALVLLTGMLCGDAVFAQGQLLFMGIRDEGAPASGRTFEQQLRNTLSSLDEVALVDYVETQRYREITDFNRYATVSQKMLGNLQRFIPDSVLIVWGSLKSIAFKPVRKNIFGAAVIGELTAGITVYDLQLRGFSYNGNVVSTISAKESPVYFSPVEKVTHITASERAALTDSLIRLTVASSTDVIKSLLKSGRKTRASSDADNNSRSNAPSISDVFTVPSVEAARIERSGGAAVKKAATAPSADSAKSPVPK